MKKLMLTIFVFSLLLLNGWNSGMAANHAANSIVTASLSILVQGADQTLSSDPVSSAADSKDKPFDWKALIIGLFFLSFYAYAIIWIVITLVKAKAIMPVSKEDYIRMRKEANKSETASEEENKSANALLDEIYFSWKVTSEPGEEEKRSPVTMSQIKKSKELLSQATAIMPTNDAVIEYQNGLANVVNSQETRSFSGSWKLVGMAVLAMIIMYLLTKTSSGGFWHFMKSFWFMPVAIIMYYFASLAPRFLQLKRERWFKGKNIHNVLIGTILGLFIATPATETWVTKWSDGSKTKSEEINPFFIFMLILTFMLILFLGFMTIIFAGINFIRNYVVYV
jgi:hypothetical protein